MRNDSPVFIVGSGRCGTSMLLRIINKYTSIAIPAESHFIPRFKKVISEYEPLEDDDNIFKLLLDIKNYPYVRDWDFSFNENDIFKRINHRTYSGVIEAIYTAYALQRNKVRWGDKTPPYLSCMSELYQLFPDAKFIHIIRDGRDCSLSVIQCVWGPMNLYKAAFWWKNGMIRGRKQLEILKSVHSDIDNFYLEVRYEDILLDPNHWLKVIFEFIGERFDSKILDDFEFKTNNIYKWKEYLSDHEKKLFENIAGDLLSAYDYDCMICCNGNIPSVYKIYYSIDNKIRSLKNLLWDCKRKLYNKMYIRN